MPTFTSFSDLLPDPNNKINAAGASDATGSAGPGFAKIKFASNNQVQVSRTISGRGVATSPGSHNWAFDISYNPMTRDEFDPVSSFLETRQGRFKPFYVILPQHAAPKNSLFAAYAAANTITSVGTTAAGSPSIMITGTGMLEGTYGNPSPGDFFTITDSANVNHTKTYKVVRVETNATYQVGSAVPTTIQRRIWTQPPIARSVAAGSTINFVNPKFRVIQKGDVVEYDLDTDNLYQFSLSLEEIQP
jgi:hypothetical protein